MNYKICARVRKGLKLCFLCHIMRRHSKLQPITYKNWGVKNEINKLKYHEWLTTRKKLSTCYWKSLEADESREH